LGQDTLGLNRQYDFSRGPNYTDGPLGLADTELAETDNFYYEGGLKTIPGATRLLATTAMGGSPNAITGIFHYEQKDGTQKFVVTTDGGRMAYQNGSAWTNISTTLSTVAKTYWSWSVFNDTLIAASGSNAVKKWDGTTFADLGGTPPQGRFVSVHTDYVLLAGHTSAPSKLRYSDTNDPNTWPAGNSLNVGLDDGQIITGLQRLGDVTVVFKERSIYSLSGASPTDFQIDATLSEVGCIAPNSIVLTDAGIFFWSEAGPAMFNGFRTVLLQRRLRALMDAVDWTNPTKISAAYYPYRKQLLVSYQRTGQSAPDRILLLDMYRLGDDNSPTNFWPILYGASQLGDAEDSAGRHRVYIGTAAGHVNAWDSGTTFDTNTIVSRARSRPYTIGRPDRVQGARNIDLWLGSTPGNLVVRYAVDGATSFTTHASTPISMNTAGSDLTFLRLDGDGSGKYITGQLIQLEILNQTTGLTLHGLEIGVEDFGRRG
jgi:hypothetical protein